MLTNLLRGATPRAQQRFDQLIASIGDNPNLLWYPSAGDDYRDLMEFSPLRAAQNGLEELPDLFMHTDYMPEWLQTNRIIHREQFRPVVGEKEFTRNQQAQMSIAYQDDRTTVRIEGVYPLAFREPESLQYRVSPEYAVFPDAAYPEPRVYLLDVCVESAQLGAFRKPVLYFFFENVNFLEEVLLKNRLKVTHLLKVREGCGFGGNRKCISLSYAFLSALQTRYLVVDDEVHFDHRLQRRIQARHRLNLKQVLLERKGRIGDWSGFGRVDVFGLTHGEDALDRVTLHKLLEQVHGRKMELLNI